MTKQVIKQRHTFSTFLGEKKRRKNMNVNENPSINEGGGENPKYKCLMSVQISITK